MHAPLQWRSAMANTSSLIAIVTAIVSIRFMSIRLMSTADSYLVSAAVTPRQYYVTPINEIPCKYLVDQDPCLSLEVYANQPDTYFVNNTIFYFYPGTHGLNTSLNVHNITMQGLPGNETVFLMLETLVNITWDTCYGVEICSISLKLAGSFLYSIAFEQSHFVRLFNVTVLGSEMGGQSSTMIQNSSLDIAASKFIAIRGYIGAALQTDFLLYSCNFYRKKPIQTQHG